MNFRMWVLFNINKSCLILNTYINKKFIIRTISYDYLFKEIK
ncbi:hypothetical protein GLOIN_2v1549946 [Rhizophagus irregularis DAOM 181602=DAOM 197198]|nr:hypothetical protein GLOIN_2v1549946 [Rhizophagus irregularis DAOM 181602=DAOM 197198]